MMPIPDSPSGEPEPAESATPDASTPLVKSEELMQGRRELLIVHCQEVYRLRLTRNGKLILTK